MKKQEFVKLFAKTMDEILELKEDEHEKQIKENND
jgi:hypothetical protein